METKIDGLHLLLGLMCLASVAFSVYVFREWGKTIDAWKDSIDQAEDGTGEEQTDRFKERHDASWN